MDIYPQPEQRYGQQQFGAPERQSPRDRVVAHLRKRMGPAYIYLRPQEKEELIQSLLRPTPRKYR